MIVKSLEEIMGGSVIPKYVVYLNSGHPYDLELETYLDFDPVTQTYRIKNMDSIYEVAALLLPTKKGAEDGVRAQLVLPVTTVIANSDSEARNIAMLKIDNKDVLEKTDRLQILVRRFQ